MDQDHPGQVNGFQSTALSGYLINCHSCRLLCRTDPKLTPAILRCPRCGAALHFRKPSSVSRTWAFLIAAYIMYIPANLLPIMKTTSLGTTQEDTIISGVIFLISSGSWPLALVVFIASIVVPVLKLILLTGLVISVQRRSRWKPVERTRLYRLTETIGRWSMVDIFVVTLMVALVKIQGLAEIDAGMGAAAFGAVVVLTILAAMVFDPRLIWDCHEHHHE